MANIKTGNNTTTREPFGVTCSNLRYYFDYYSFSAAYIFVLGQKNIKTPKQKQQWQSDYHSLSRSSPS